MNTTNSQSAAVLKTLDWSDMTEAEAAASLGLDLDTFHAAGRLQIALEILAEAFEDAEPPASKVTANKRPKRTKGLGYVATFMDCAACELELILHRAAIARTGDRTELAH